MDDPYQPVDLVDHVYYQITDELTRIVEEIGESSWINLLLSLFSFFILSCFSFFFFFFSLSSLMVFLSFTFFWFFRGEEGEKQATGCKSFLA